MTWDDVGDEKSDKRDEEEKSGRRSRRRLSKVRRKGGHLLSRSLC